VALVLSALKDSIVFFNCRPGGGKTSSRDAPAIGRLVKEGSVSRGDGLPSISR
jgi:hypothetical protein